MIKILGDENLGANILNNKTAIILVDMLNDFVTGPLSCDSAKTIVQPLKELITTAREKGTHIIYANDCHYKGVDKELELWGDHAIAGTKGAEVVPELAPQSSDFVVPKRRYSGFFQTDLHLILTELGVENVIITGLHTHICIRHTTADAYCWGYEIYIPSDCIGAFTKEDYDSGMEYLKTVYGAKIFHSKEFQ